MNIPLNKPVKKLDRRESLSDLLIHEEPKKMSDRKEVELSNLVTFRNIGKVSDQEHDETESQLISIKANT